MHLKIEQHRIQGIDYLPSDNYNERPKNTQLSLIVIHGISLPPGNFEGNTVEDCFMNQLDISSHPYYERKLKNNPISSHVYLRRNGKIIQFVPFNKRAWHAGVSNYKGHDDCNNFSIGIELQGSSQHQYTVIQYTQLAKIIYSLKQTYFSLKNAPIVGHRDISKGRKTDPWSTFNWSKLNQLHT